MPCFAAFSGLRVDIDRIRADNAAKTDAKRKSGLIIWSGGEEQQLAARWLGCPTQRLRLQATACFAVLQVTWGLTASLVSSVPNLL